MQDSAASGGGALLGRPLRVENEVFPTNRAAAREPDKRTVGVSGMVAVCSGSMGGGCKAVPFSHVDGMEGSEEQGLGRIKSVF